MYSFEGARTHFPKRGSHGWQRFQVCYEIRLSILAFLSSEALPQ